METQTCPSSFADSQRWLPKQPLQIHMTLKMGCQCGGCCHPLGLSSGPSDTLFVQGWALCVGVWNLEEEVWSRRGQCRH